MRFFVSLVLVLLCFNVSAQAEIKAPQPAPNVVAGSVIQKICKHREAILDAAEAKEIPAQHMIACLISEHTFLVNDTDHLVDAAAALGVYDDPSLGMAQIKLSTARPLAQQIYGKEMSSQKIIADLLNPKIAALYMAQLIKNILDDHAEFGFDLTNSPGIVCSSYLVGQSRRRAQEHKKNGTQPALNYYGRFASRVLKTADRIEAGENCK